MVLILRTSYSTKKSGHPISIYGIPLNMRAQHILHIHDCFRKGLDRSIYSFLKNCQLQTVHNIMGILHTNKHIFVSMYHVYYDVNVGTDPIDGDKAT